MKTEGMNVVEWQKRFGTEEACAAALAKHRWPKGFQCPRCGHDHGSFISPAIPTNAAGATTRPR